MKKQLMRFVNVRMFSKFIGTTAVLVLLSGAYTQTQAAPVSATIVNAGPGVGKTIVSHLSSDNNSLLFQVKVDNAAGEKFTIVVKDNTGSTLYRGSFTDKDFSKKFRLPKNDSETITFSVKSESSNSTESFEINSNTRVVEEVVVKKVL